MCLGKCVNVRDERHRGEGQRGEELHTVGAYMFQVHFAYILSELLNPEHISSRDQRPSG